MTGYFIWVRETTAIKLHECISTLTPTVSSLMTFSHTKVCPVLTLLCKRNAFLSRNAPGCCFVPHYHAGSLRGVDSNRAHVTWLPHSIMNLLEFPGGSAGKGPSAVTAVARVQALAQDLPHAADAAMNKRRAYNRNRRWCP